MYTLLLDRIADSGTYAQCIYTHVHITAVYLLCICMYQPYEQICVYMLMYLFECGDMDND